MAYFIPSYFQKRILRYALSRLELLDTDALDIEKLDLVWGKRTTIELRDVGLQLPKIASWLHLPTCIIPHKGTIALLRLTVPADLYASGILLEIEGVDVGASFDTSKRDDEETRKKKKKAGLARGTKANMPRSTQPQVHDPGGSFRERLSGEKARDDEENALPTTVGLAESFLQHEGARSKGELELAMAKSRSLDASQLSELGDEASEVGLGTGLSLPTFLSDFLQGIVDRLQLQISRVSIGIDMNIDSFSAFSTDSSLDNPYNITFCLKLDSISMSGVPRDNTSSSSPGGRNIILSNIRGSIISEPSLFATLSQMSGPPSPVMYQKSRDIQGVKRNAASSNISSAGSGTDLAQSSILRPVQRPPSDPTTTDHADPPFVEALPQDSTPALSHTTGSLALQRSTIHESGMAPPMTPQSVHTQQGMANDETYRRNPFENNHLEDSLSSSMMNFPADLSRSAAFPSLQHQRQSATASMVDHDRRGSLVSHNPADSYESRRFAMAGSWDSSF